MSVPDDAVLMDVGNKPKVVKLITDYLRYHDSSTNGPF